MSYRIDFKGIEETYKFTNDESKKVRLIHSSGKKYKLLPFTASDNNIDNFRGVVGEFARATTNKKMEKYDKHQLIGEVVSKVKTDNKTALTSIINELLFNEDDELVIAHPQLFNYIKTKKNEAKVGQFLATILVTDELKHRLVELFETDPNNVLLKLVCKYLPQLEDQKSLNTTNYTIYVNHIKEQFEGDLLFLLKSNKLFIDYFEMFIKYYYFYYVNQLTINLDQFFNAKEDVYPIYFNLDWETRSKSRKSYTEGWKVLAPKLDKLFSHVNCLELINHREHTTELIRYMDIKVLLEEMDEVNKEVFRSDLKKLITTYKEKVNDVVWENYKAPIQKNDDDILNLIRELFGSIHYQFLHSSRKKPAQLFYKGFEEFVKKNFLKRSGPLGYTLNIKQDFLIFLTKLCINDQERIALNDLFSEFSKRGINFDRDSRKSIVDLFEKLNLLEKKSDSGDAQYVKYIL